MTTDQWKSSELVHAKFEEHPKQTFTPSVLCNGKQISFVDNFVEKLLSFSVDYLTFRNNNQSNALTYLNADHFSAV